MHLRCLVVAAVTLAAARAGAQIPEKFDNLQFFPRSARAGES